ncbi:hypothetical protein B0H13DRAFT_2350906 [Mycena leptocephala]|nr:hypothetical protein B0H13DRAFT_2350906 [Mycena leptocephala]
MVGPFILAYSPRFSFPSSHLIVIILPSSSSTDRLTLLRSPATHATVDRFVKSSHSMAEMSQFFPGNVESTVGDTSCQQGPSVRPLDRQMTSDLGRPPRERAVCYYAHWVDAAQRDRNDRALDAKRVARSPELKEHFFAVFGQTKGADKWCQLVIVRAGLGNSQQLFAPSSNSPLQIVLTKYTAAHD